MLIACLMLALPWLIRRWEFEKKRLLNGRLSCHIVLTLSLTKVMYIGRKGGRQSTFDVIMPGYWAVVHRCHQKRKVRNYAFWYRIGAVQVIT